MNSYPQNKKIVFVLALLIASSGLVFAQKNPDPSAKRNSPFAPNPKKKIAAPQVNLAVAPAIAAADAPKRAAQNAPAPETAPQLETAPPIETAPPAEFESRSVAARTLEVAKRASVANLPPTETYKIGVGDVLFVSLQNAPAKESNYFTVLKDGTIDYPLAGEMPSVAGLTGDEIETLLTEKIKLYENPQVSVRVREHNSHSYTVLGMVEKPGEKFLQREAVPLFVVRAEAIAHGKASRAVIKRSNAETETVSLKDKKYEEILIFSGDIVEFSADGGSVSSDAPQFYYIGGNISSGGQKDFHAGLTLTRAILACGGLKKENAKKVVVRRRNEAGLLTVTEYDLKAIKDGKAADPALEAGDTVEIGN